MSFVAGNPSAEGDAVSLTLSADEAVVLIDWLQDADLESVPMSHVGHKHALLALLLRLDAQIDLSALSDGQLNAARDRLAHVQADIDRAAEDRST